LHLALQRLLDAGRCVKGCTAQEYDQREKEWFHRWVGAKWSFRSVPSLIRYFAGEGSCCCLKGFKFLCFMKRDSVMITKESANSLADEVIANERTRIADDQDAKATRIPLTLRVDGLLRLAPRHQAELLHIASKAVNQNLAFQLAGVVWVASVALLWYFVQPVERTLMPTWTLTPLLGVLVIRRWFVRKELKHLVSNILHASATR